MSVGKMALQNKFPDSSEGEAVKVSAPWLIEAALLARQLKGAVIFDVFFKQLGGLRQTLGLAKLSEDSLRLYVCASACSGKPEAC